MSRLHLNPYYRRSLRGGLQMSELSRIADRYLDNFGSGMRSQLRLLRSSMQRSPSTPTPVRYALTEMLRAISKSELRQTIDLTIKGKVQPLTPPTLPTEGYGTLKTSSVANFTLSGNSPLLVGYEIRQGMLGSCSLLSATPDNLTIYPNDNGTFSMFFGVAGQLRRMVTIDGWIFTDGSQDMLTRFIEKAYAVYRDTIAGTTNGYAIYQPGVEMLRAVEDLTGRSGQFLTPANSTADQRYQLASLVNSGSTATLAVMTPSYNPALPLVADHAYRVVSLDTETSKVILWNPWGVDGRWNPVADFDPYDGFITLDWSDIAAIADIAGA